jgi:hypothetical protein
MIRLLERHEIGDLAAKIENAKALQRTAAAFFERYHCKGRQRHTWSGLSLREMAERVNQGDEYDIKYDWLSQSAHGALRSMSALDTTCPANPDLEVFITTCDALLAIVERPAFSVASRAAGGQLQATAIRLRQRYAALRSSSGTRFWIDSRATSPTRLLPF